MPQDDDAAQRARNRAGWKIRRGSLADQADEELSDTTTPEQRLDMMWQLALDAWAFMGAELPTYDRASMPGRIIRKP